MSAVTSESLKQHIIEHEIVLESHNITIGGDILVDDNILWLYDTSRSKWLSIDRFKPGGGESGKSKDKYLPVFDGQTLNLTGWRLPRDGTIVGIVAQTRLAATWTLEVRKNGALSAIASLAIAGTTGDHVRTTDVDVDEGDRIQLYANGDVRDPLVWIEIAWRNDSLTIP